MHPSLSFFHRKVYGRLPFWILLVLAIGPFATRASLEITVVVPGTITVSYGDTVTGFTALSVLDQNCQKAVSQAVFPAFADPTPGATSTTTLCIRNTGDTPFQLMHPGPLTANNSITFQGLPSGITGDWTVIPNPLELRPGTQGTVTIILISGGTVPRDSYAFEILITAYKVTA